MSGAQRLRIARIAAGAMYLGPLLAGIAGHGWSVLPVFAAVFLLWQVLMRPAVFPNLPEAWDRPAVMRNAVLTLAVQLALVAALLAVGRGLGGMLAAWPAVPEYLPPALALAAVAVARAVALSPRRAAEVPPFLARAVAEIEGGRQHAVTEPDPDRRVGQPEPDGLRRLERLLPALALRVAAGVPGAGPEMDALVRLGLPEAVWAELSARAGEDAAWQRLRLAFLAHPGVPARAVHEEAVIGALEDAFALGDPGLDAAAIAAARAWVARAGGRIDDARAVRAGLALWSARFAAEDPAGRGAALASFLAAVDAAAAARAA